MAVVQLKVRDAAGAAGATVGMYALAVTPHDSTNISTTVAGDIPRALFVGTGGNVVVVMEDATTVTFTNVQGGSIIPIRCIRVNSTNTTASNIVALF